jgi:hypothetical protein
MTTRVDGRIVGGEPGRIKVFAQHILHSPHFSSPVRVLPWTTHGRDVIEPVNL